MAESTLSTVEKLFRRLWLRDNVFWDNYQLRQDPEFRHINKDDRQEIPLLAAEAAVRSVNWLRGNFGLLQPSAYAEQLSIPIIDERPSCNGQAPFIAMAGRRPVFMVVAPEAFAAIAETVERLQLGQDAGDPALWRETAIAFELYRHLGWSGPWACRADKEIVVKRFRLFRRRLSLSSVVEIAGRRFAYFITGEKFRFELLELLFLASRDLPAAKKRLEKLDAL